MGPTGGVRDLGPEGWVEGDLDTIDRERKGLGTGERGEGDLDSTGWGIGGLGSDGLVR